MTNATFYRQSMISSQPQPEEDEVDFRQLLTPVWRRKWPLLGLAFLVMMLATLVAFNITPIYQATAKMLIEQRNNSASSLNELYGLDNSGKEYLATQFELLRSRSLAQEVVEQLNLTQHPEFDPRQQEEPLIDIGGMVSDFDIRNFLPFTTPEEVDVQLPPEAALQESVTEKLMDRITISPVPNTQLVEVKVAMADPVMAARAANALVHAYIQQQLSSRLDMSKTATSWMNEQLGELRVNLQRSEQRLQAFREAENLVDVEGVATLTAGELTGTSTRLQEARRQMAELESQYRQISSVPADDWRRLSSVQAVMNDPLVNEFRSAEAQARSKVEELARTFGPKYPTMIAARTELEAASESLREQVAEVVNSIERKYRLATSTVESLEASLTANKGEMQDISRKEFRLRELEREVETNRQLYDTFLTRLKETSASQDFADVNAQLVEEAILPTSPVKPNKKLIVLASGFLALLGGGGLIVLTTVMNNTFKNTEDVENHLNLPVLGIVPLIKEKGDKSLLHAFDKETDRGFSESIRTLRTALVFSALEKESHKVILVTSSVPGEGKTTVSANLASALGATKKTLLIEGDLRRPSLRKYYDLPAGTPGLSNVLWNTASLEACVHSISDTFDVLCAGAVPPNPQELLVSPRFGELMAVAKERYKYIIIDSPPSLAVSDAVVLSGHADSLIYVVRSLSTRIPEAQRGVGSFLQKNTPVTGAVLNQVDIKKAEKYGYSYRGYYDYYGYSS